MSLSTAMDFPDIQISKDPEHANYQNFLAWQAQHDARRRESITQFNMFQGRARQRMCSQALYKEEAVQQIDTLKDIVERRLSSACECDDCDRQAKDRSDSVSSPVPSSPTSSVSSSTSSLSTALPSSTTHEPSRVSSSRNSLIVNPPPRSRHHKRRVSSAT